MKLSKKELMQRISDLIEDGETKVSVLEDLDDSIIEEGTAQEVMSEEEKRDYEDLKWKYENLLSRYKERFLKGDEVATETEVVEKEEVEEDEEEPRKYEDLFDEKGELK